MSNHLAKYYMNLLFIVILGIGCITISFIGTFAEMLALHDASYNMDIILSGFNGAMIISLLKSWRCIDREIKRRLIHSPLNQIEKEWLEKNDRFLRLFKSSPQKTNRMHYSQASRLKVHGLITIVLFANIISLWLNI